MTLTPFCATLTPLILTIFELDVFIVADFIDPDPFDPSIKSAAVASQPWREKPLHRISAYVKRRIK